MKKLQSVVIITLTLLFTSKSNVFAQVVDGVYDDVVTFGWINTLFERMLGITTSIIGTAAFIMLVIGAFRWLISGGDPKALESARNTMTMAIIGIALILVSWFTLVLISQFTGNTDILQFNIIQEVQP